MGYSFQSRLRHAGNRFSEVNNECVTLIVGDAEIPLDASPILISADEESPGNVSLVRVERQDFVVWRCNRGPNGERGLGSHYPPPIGAQIRRSTGEVFQCGAMGSDEPHYTHVTSNRERVILHTTRIESGE